MNNKIIKREAQQSGHQRKHPTQQQAPAVLRPDHNDKRLAGSRFQAQAMAHANIALIKYWGKRNLHTPQLNLPAVGSLSITLDALTTTTSVCFSEHLQADQVRVNERDLQARELQRISASLDLIRALAAAQHRTDISNCFAQVESHNNFPTAAGLASSASAFAALVKAATAAAGVQLDDAALSRLARMGSGSAARSIFGGFVLLPRGQRDDGEDAVARPLQSVAHWPLRVVIAITDSGYKSVSSTDGMHQTMQTSAYFRSWVEAQNADLQQAEAAIEQRDFAQLAEVSEYSCLKMHATALAARPGVMYWNPASIACMHAIRELRAQGHAVFFTNDAGPQIKAVCLPEAETVVSASLAAIPGVQQLLCSGLGGAARVLDSQRP
ncbi:MAG: diphosphomevalonate decarboxylase [Gammaproteobacteria bacterium]|jgi:diphosphomevalonate decarboxylase|nr:diphosphomevalonate decarboxylase [Gammaproteobacteria bacterium]